VGGGNTVTITGSNLNGATNVWFGTTAATTFTVNTAGTEITAIAPAHAAGTVDISVTTPAGTTPNTAADNYAYSSATGTVTFTLYYRWSLFAWLGQDNINPMTALEGTSANPATNDVSSQVTAIYRWSADGTGCPSGMSQCWLGWFPNGVGVPGANDFTTLQYGTSYWWAINGPGPVTWTVLQGP
jgi:hypothetical protein